MQQPTRHGRFARAVMIAAGVAGSASCVPPLTLTPGAATPSCRHRSTPGG
jgi:hypothetical protein